MGASMRGSAERAGEAQPQARDVGEEVLPVLERVPLDVARGHALKREVALQRGEPLERVEERAMARQVRVGEDLGYGVPVPELVGGRGRHPVQRETAGVAPVQRAAGLRVGVREPRQAHGEGHQEHDREAARGDGPAPRQCPGHRAGEAHHQHRSELEPREREQAEHHARRDAVTALPAAQVADRLVEPGDDEQQRQRLLVERGQQIPEREVEAKGARADQRARRRDPEAQQPLEGQHGSEEQERAHEAHELERQVQGS
jgi:hypothetical protein